MITTPIYEEFFENTGTPSLLLRSGAAKILKAKPTCTATVSAIPKQKYLLIQPLTDWVCLRLATLEDFLAIPMSLNAH